MTIQGSSSVKMEQIPTRTINLEKVSKVNDLSREFTTKQISLGQFYTRLRSLDNEVKFYPIWLQIVAAAVVSGTLMMIFGGVWKDLIATCIIGAIGFVIFLLRYRVFQSEIFSGIFSRIYSWFIISYRDLDRLGSESRQDDHRRRDAISTRRSNHQRRA